MKTIMQNINKVINVKALMALTLTLTLTLLGTDARAQQDPEYSLYMFNGMANNPAYAGSRDALSGVLLLRKQWVSLDGAPTTGSFALHGPSRNKRHGFGGTFVHDRLGITRQTFLTLSYAYRLPLGPGTLALGLRGGITNFANLYSELNPLESDGINPGINLSVLLPRFGTGAYYHTERFYLGVSAPNLLTPFYRFDDPATADVMSRQRVHLFGTAGVVIPLSESIEFKPSLVAKYVDNAPLEFDFNAAFLFNRLIWVGAGYRTNDALIAMIGVETKKGFRVGYAYDYTVTKLNRVNTGTHEIMVGFDLAPGKDKVLSPRFF